MAKIGALDLAAGLGGTIGKSQVLSAVDKYEKYHASYGGKEEERKAEYSDMANKYYDLVTSFYEYGWGESFHFARRWKGESLREGMKRHEHFIASQLALRPGMKVLDVGCGIGGPLREIARFSSTSITGLTNNDYHIKRGEELNRIAGVDKTCNFVKDWSIPIFPGSTFVIGGVEEHLANHCFLVMQADFMRMPFSSDTFDAAFAIDATCHAPDACECYKEIYRILKPGQYFAAYEWCMTDSFDPNNEEHQKIKAKIEIGNGLPDIRLTRQIIEALERAGFEVIWEKDLSPDSYIPWYAPMDENRLSLSNFRTTALGRWITTIMVKALEGVGLAPEGSLRVKKFLEQAAEGLYEGGRREILTPMYFFVARKPESKSP